ncbi:hypothetical protein ABZR86_02550 [Dyella marensis]|uniref:Uncharacterized protein n=1 Tax=Dyella marensis TaxID=500610 RepID=A0A1I2A1Z9_9GAMM|nr:MULTISPECIES: hypothetical protein [Dyella]SFE36943.1 hypothetical protein SAMN02799615_00864 [Dyella marensis]
MNFAKLLARLNQTTVRYDIGMGGRPELTAQDIAAALGLVQPGIGRDLMEMIWWPEGAKLRIAYLNAVLTEMQLVEHNRREQAMYSALAGVAVGPLGEERIRAHSAYSHAHSRRWPAWIKRLDPLEVAEGYEGIRATVLLELARPRHCQTCEGRGEIFKRDLVVACARCEGSGTREFGPTWRAEQMGMTEQAFKKTWEGPYLWLLDRLRGELEKAENSLRGALA